ncbi:hypothetical protein DJ018_10460 [Phenylobacterium deserti]|uniref:Uncharacterized protein n=1 Tax=Phenylobacterium deserti TaxID=1914756 RepID=A0A328ADP0_9CAUL|nr:hypothetical protein DJ018_10460 [Phenylobacterium deserti]
MLRAIRAGRRGSACWRSPVASQPRAGYPARRRRVVASAVVAFSIFVQRLSMPWMIHRLGLTRPAADPADRQDPATRPASGGAREIGRDTHEIRGERTAAPSSGKGAFGFSRWRLVSPRRPAIVRDKRVAQSASDRATV